MSLLRKDTRVRCPLRTQHCPLDQGPRTSPCPHPAFHPGPHGLVLWGVAEGGGEGSEEEESLLFVSVQASLPFWGKMLSFKIPLLLSEILKGAIT